MSDMTLTNDEKRCLQMWFRQAIVQLEREEARQRITAFYNGTEQKPRITHYAPVSRRTNRRLQTHSKELV